MFSNTSTGKVIPFGWIKNLQACKHQASVSLIYVRMSDQLNFLDRCSGLDLILAQLFGQGNRFLLLGRLPCY